MTDDPRPDEAPEQNPTPAQEPPMAPPSPPAPDASVARQPTPPWQPPASTQPFPAEQPPVQPEYTPGPPIAGSQQQRSPIGPAVLAAVLAALVIGAFAGLAGGFLGAKMASSSFSAGGSAQTITVVPSTTDEPVVAAAAAAVPSVVNIDVTEGATAGGQGGLPSTHPTVPLSGNGSGVAYKSTPDGGTYILTNNHVVESAKTITVRSPGGQSWPATVVGRDPDSDIAVVKIAGKLPPIKLADAKNIVVGQTVVAIGSPYGLEHSVTSGVVSAIGRSLSDVGTTGQSQPLVDAIQTDAAINPGNSGGALVDRQGRLVGINTAIYSQSGSAAGIGFAVPVDTATRVADQLIGGGKVTHPFIGIIGSTITPLVAQQQKLPVTEGALVEEVVKGAGAANAGVKTNDIVTAVDGKSITSMNDLVAAVRKHSVGDTAELTILRGGQTLKLKVQVSDRPAGMTATVPSTSTPTTP